MRKSIKVLAMLVVATMLLSMAAFAAEVTPGTVSHTESGDDYNIVVNFSASDYSDGDQVTMLVLTGSNTIQFAEDGVTPTNVGYIDQKAIDGATGSFTFAVAKDYVENNEVYVKLGATDKAAASDKTYNFENGDAPLPDGDDDVTITETDISNAFGVEGLKIVKITGVDGTKSLSVEGATVVYVEHDGVGMFFVITSGTVTADDLSWSDEAPTASLMGDVNNEGGVDVLDATSVLEVAVAGFGDMTDAQKFLADVDGSGAIDVLDATTILEIIIGAVPPIFTK